MKKTLEKPKLSDLAPLVAYLPPLIARREVGRMLGGLVSSKTLANHDCRGTGPRVRIETPMGVAYPTDFLLEWIEARGLHVRKKD